MGTCFFVNSVEKRGHPETPPTKAGGRSGRENGQGQSGEERIQDLEDKVRALKEELAAASDSPAPGAARCVMDESILEGMGDEVSRSFCGLRSAASLRVSSDRGCLCGVEICSSSRGGRGLLFVCFLPPLEKLDRCSLCRTTSEERKVNVPGRSSCSRYNMVGPRGQLGAATIPFARPYRKG